MGRGESILLRLGWSGESLMGGRIQIGPWSVARTSQAHSGNKDCLDWWSRLSKGPEIRRMLGCPSSGRSPVWLERRMHRGLLMGRRDWRRGKTHVHQDCLLFAQGSLETFPSGIWCDPILWVPNLVHVFAWPFYFPMFGFIRSFIPFVSSHTPRPQKSSRPSALSVLCGRAEPWWESRGQREKRHGLVIPALSTLLEGQTWEVTVHDGGS